VKLADLSIAQLADRLKRGGVCLHIGPLITRLQVLLPGIARHIHFLYGHTPIEDQPCVVDVEVKLAGSGGVRGWLRSGAMIYLDGVKTFGPFDRSIAVPMLEWCLNGCVFNRPNQFLILHAAVMERGGRAVMMPAPPGTGKSTLCAALALRGWRLFSDEVALICPSDGRVTPVPRPVNLKEGSIDAIKRFEPTARIGTSWPGTRKGTVAHMRAPDDSVDRVHETALPAWIICPRYEAGTGAGASLEPIPKAETMLYIANDAFNYSLLGSVGFETLAATVDRCDCYAFVYSDLDQAMKVFDELSGAYTDHN